MRDLLEENLKVLIKIKKKKNKDTVNKLNLISQCLNVIKNILIHVEILLCGNRKKNESSAA